MSESRCAWDGCTGITGDVTSNAGAFSRRQFLGRAGRIATLPLLPSLAGSLVAACGGDDGEQAPTSAAGSGRASPGTTIPRTSLSFGIAPYTEETVFIVGIQKGWFNEVGIDVTEKKQDLSATLAPLLTDDVHIGGSPTNALAPQIEEVDNVVSFLLISTYVGGAFWAPADTPFKTLTEFLDEGLPHDEAYSAAIQQFKGKKVVVSTDPASKNRHQLMLEMGGLTLDDINRTDLEEPNIVTAILGGRADVGAPASPSSQLRLADEGSKEIVNVRQILESSTDPRRIQLPSVASELTKRDYYEDNYETLLRFSSVFYRIVDLVRRDIAEVARLELPYLNAYAGGNVTEDELDFVYKNVSLLTSFEETDALLNDPEEGFNSYVLTQGVVDGLREQGVLQEAHDVGEFMVMRDVYNDLKKYKEDSDVLFEQFTGDTSQADIVSQARAQYDARNYLDSYRFLASISER